MLYIYTLYNIKILFIKGKNKQTQTFPYSVCQPLNAGKCLGRYTFRVVTYREGRRGEGSRIWVKSDSFFPPYTFPSIL